MKVLSVLWIKNEENININFIVDCEVEKELTIERVRQFKHILLYYLDFLQKQKVTFWYVQMEVHVFMQYVSALFFFQVKVECLLIVFKIEINFT